MIAVIIPYFKITFFEATLQSLAHQTDKRFKVYIGDDASSENPIELLEKYKGKFDFFYHRFDENLGGTSLTKQWQRCIDLSGEEEWIMILGDDDTLSISCIADLYANLKDIEGNECKVVRYATVVNDMAAKSISRLYTHPKLEKVTGFICRRFTNQTRSSLSEYVFKREVYQKYGFCNYNLAWHSDDRAWLEFSEFGYIYSINSAHVCFRLSAENISRRGFRIKEKDQATLAFYNFLIFKNCLKFNRFQRRQLLLVYEQFIYKINKVNFSFFILGFTFLCVNFYFLESLKFTRRVLIYLNRNVHNS